MLKQLGGHGYKIVNKLIVEVAKGLLDKYNPDLCKDFIRDLSTGIIDHTIWAQTLNKLNGFKPRTFYKPINIPSQFK